jgi:hypothetical protein
VTGAPKCPSCGDPLGTPVNVECGVERGRWYGPEGANLKCPSCGAGWVVSDRDVANAWRAFVEYEQTQVQP